MLMLQIEELYLQWKGEAPARTEQLPGAGSNRVYYRLSGADGSTVVGCVGTSAEENHAFIVLARHFCRQGLPVPEVLAVSSDETCYLQQDLGSTALFDALRQGRESGGKYCEQEISLLVQTIRLLPQIQVKGAQELDFSVCYPQPEFDTTGVMFDLNYFKYCFLKTTGTDFHELRLEYDFRQLAADLTSVQADTTTFLYRDFQARNVMLVPSEEEPGAQRPFFIDFQGGRKGPIYYDLASFLWQASARYPDELRRRLLDVYYTEAARYMAMPTREEFDRRLRLFVLFRLMQVLGAYGFRGHFERKQHFINSIPPAIDSLRHLLAAGDFPYPELMQVLHKLCTPHPLRVRIFSFSYKQGIPQDESGNGGGYVFDCRATHNPGRYEQYKHLTGLDAPVIKFLEDDGEILGFLSHIYPLAESHVKRYLERGFSSLMFSFGCTGGQHRSVYCAEHLAEYIHQKFPMVEVQLCHREQGINKLLK